MSAGERAVDAGRGAVSWGLKGFLGLMVGVPLIAATVVGAGALAFFGTSVLGAVGLAALAAGATGWFVSSYATAALSYSALAGGIKGVFTSRAQEPNAPALEQQMIIEQQRAMMLQEQMNRKQDLATVSANCADPDAKGGFAARVQAANSITNNITTPQPGVPSV